VVSWSESHVKNTNTAKEITKNLNVAWPLISGAIAACEDELPPKMLKDVKALDEIVICGGVKELRVKCKEGTEISQDIKDKYAAGYALVLHGKIGTKAVETAIKEILDVIEKIAPNLLTQILALI